CNFSRADRGADLEEQMVRLAEVALAGGFVTGKPSQLRALDVEEGFVAFRAGHFEPSGGFGDRGLDVRCRFGSLDPAESAPTDELCWELPQSGAPSPARGDRFLRESQGRYAIAEPQVRRRHSCKHVGLDNGKSAILDDCRSRSQRIECVAPCVVQSVCKPECEVSKDSGALVARSLGIVHRVPSMGLSSRYLARDVTAKDGPAVRNGERHQLFGASRQVNHLVELGCAFARIPGQAQNGGMEI